jgi:hypothetical protein
MIRRRVQLGKQSEIPLEKRRLEQVVREVQKQRRRLLQRLLEVADLTLPVFLCCLSSDSELALRFAVLLALFLGEVSC